jgi:hypothetical protein
MTWETDAHACAAAALALCLFLLPGCPASRPAGAGDWGGPDVADWESLAGEILTDGIGDGALPADLPVPDALPVDTAGLDVAAPDDGSDVLAVDTGTDAPAPDVAGDTPHGDVGPDSAPTDVQPTDLGRDAPPPCCASDRDCEPIGGPCRTGHCVDCACVVHVGCDDGEPCTIDFCDTTNLRCRHWANPACGCKADGDCDDGDGCTVDQCLQGTCGHGPADCYDGDPCTVDLCAQGACRHDPVPDCLGCARDDECRAAGPCTAGFCNLQTLPARCEVRSAPDRTACDDGDPCTVQDACQAGFCAGLPRTCADNNPCTADSCDAALLCLHQPIPGCGPSCTTDIQCNDWNQCTQDRCDNGTCRYGTTDCGTGSCADFWCDRLLGCYNLVNPECVRCASVQDCQVADACLLPSCEDRTHLCMYAVRPCDDGDVCTTDGCDPAIGCRFTPIPGCCMADGDCDDRDCCTKDSCQTSRCVHQRFSCDDGDACTQDSCDCVTGGCRNEPAECDDGNACTRDACDPTIGCYHLAMDGVACDDLDTCTTGDECTGTVCRGAPQACDDGIACTTDFCDRDAGCVHVIDPACTCSTRLDCDDGEPATCDCCCELPGPAPSSCYNVNIGGLGCACGFLPGCR